MILARHAEALLWVGRYLERAETTARCLQVADSLIMHLQPEVARDEWAQLIRALGLADEFAAEALEPQQRQVTEFLLASSDSAGSVPAAIAAVRENLRVARDRVPIELWEEANRLHLSLWSMNTASVVREPNDTLVAVRRGCQAMSGVIGEAMGRDEGHAFIVLGRMLERCMLTVDLVRAEIATDEVRVIVTGAGEDVPAPEALPADWVRFNDYGIALMAEGDTRAAADAFASVERLDPERLDGALNQARTALAEGDLDGAYAALDRTEAIEPGNARASWVWGQALQEDGLYPEAEAAYRRVLDTFPGDRATWSYEWYASRIGGAFPVLDCTEAGLVSEPLDCQKRD